jgi:hypothetical protein
MPTDNFPQPIFSIRFIGEQLDQRSVPIYELGQVFIAIQRLYHKAYLVERDRLEKGAFPDKGERQNLALQVSVREKRSDMYGLAPFLADPTFMAMFRSLTEHVLLGIESYARHKLLEWLRGDKETKKQIYIGSIHAEVVNIVDRIDGTSGCSSILIGSPTFHRGPPIQLDARTRAYAHDVSGEYYLGQVQTMRGSVYKLYPNILMVEIRRRPGSKKCKLYFNEKDFDRVRYHQIRSPLVTVTGRPRFRIGTERHSFDEFEVNKIETIEDELV